jgi:hypothetical protein
MTSFSGDQPSPAHGQPGLCGPLSTRELGDRLGCTDAPAALRQITRWLEEIAPRWDCPLPQCLDAIDQLDRLAHNHQLRLQPQGLDVQRMHRLGDSPLGQANFGYWKALGDAYGRCLRRYAAADSVDTRLPLVAGRQLRALGLQLEWALLLYAPVEERIWHDLGLCYRLLENSDATEQPCQVYAGRHGLSTPRQELLRPLLLAVAMPGALTPGQIHVAERLAAHFAHGGILQATPGPDCPFAFDLAAARAPARLASDRPALATQRFFGAGSVTAALQAMMAQVRQQGRIPAEVGLDHGYEPAEMLRTLEHLELHWSGRKRTRHSQRWTPRARLTVTPGLVQSARWLDHLRQPGRPAEAIPPIQAHSWNIADVGANGLCALLPAALPDGIGVGTLVGIRTDLDALPRMGIVRRLAPTADGRTIAGLELLGETAIAVTLHPLAALLDAQAPHGGQAAILLSRRPDREGTIELLLIPDGLSMVRTLQMQLRDRVYRLDFIRLAEHGRDYLRASYQLLPRAAQTQMPP